MLSIFSSSHADHKVRASVYVCVLVNLCMYVHMRQRPRITNYKPQHKHPHNKLIHHCKFNPLQSTNSLHSPQLNPPQNPFFSPCIQPPNCTNNPKDTLPRDSAPAHSRNGTRQGSRRD